jgi:hypothetical protein
MSVLSPDAVELTVQRVNVSVQPDGQISCDPELLVVTGADVQIAFVLNASGWIFPATGAVVVQGSSLQFPQPAKTVTDRLVTLVDRNSVPGTFSYQVYVQNANTGVVRHIDPTIRNEG